MIKAIIFKGKGLDGFWYADKWFEGDLIYNLMDEDQLIYPANIRASFNAHIDPETISICSGIKDIYEEMLWSGDIIKDADENIGIIKFKKSEEYFGFIIEWNDGDICTSFNGAHIDLRKLGNIFDNPELIKEVKDV